MAIVDSMADTAIIIHIPPRKQEALTKDEQATIDSCLEIRRIVFVEGQRVPQEIECDAQEYACGHLLLLENSRAVGTLRYRRTEEGMKLERIAVLPSYRGKNFGKRLVEAAIHYIRTDDEDVSLYLHAQLASEGFYRRLGFVDDGTPIFKEAGIEHRNMRWPSSEPNTHKE